MTMIDHTVRAFDTDLQQLVRKIGTMGSLVERQARDAIDALLKHDAHELTRFGRRDAARDRGYSDRQMARRQPMAIDLRQLVGAFQIAKSLSGDFIKDCIAFAT